MRKLVLGIIGVFSFFLVNGQNTLFSENFESATFNMTSSSTGSAVWAPGTYLASQGNKSDTCVVTPGDTTYLTSNNFSTVGMYSITLSFDHICKIEFSDHGYVEVSNNGGATWIRLTTVEYLGSGQFANSGNGFNTLTYVTDWLAAFFNAIPTSAWWKSESFDVSALIPNASQVKIRFVLIDGNGTGASGNYGWLIDDIKVLGSFSEMTPPVVNFIPPIIQDTTYTSGPYEIKAHITDSTGIDTALVIYHVMPNNIWDTIGMSIISTDTFQGDIPFYGYGRTISYYVKAIDASIAQNTDSTVTKQFICKYSVGGDVIIGTSSLINHLPIEPYYGYSYSQSIFKSSHFAGTAGTITKLAYYYNGGGAFSGDAIIIYMSTTSNVSYASSSSWLPISGFTTVYTGTLSATTTAGWIEFTLQTPFNYSGSGNLVIAFEENTPGYHSSLSDFYCSQLDNDFSSIYYYSDGTNPNPQSPPSGTIVAYTPNVKLTFVGSGSNISNDIGISDITSPGASINAGQAFPVKVQLKNFGNDTLNQATIQWRMDGVMKPPYSFIGNLMPGDTINQINLGIDTVAVGAHHLKVWTENPNGVSDFNIINDTSDLSFFACSSMLSGSYTIGGSGANFNTINDAILGLKQCGINGPVIFNVNNGTYTEHMELGTVSGISAINNITFQSTSGDSSQVIVQYNAAGSADNYVFKLESASYMKFKGITWKALDSNYCKVFDLLPGTHHIGFENNRFIAFQHNLYSNLDEAVLVNTDTLGANVDIISNRFEGGAKGIIMTSNTSIANWKLKYNEFINQYASGATIIKALDLMVDGNYLRSSTSYGGFVGITLIENSGASFIKENDLVVISAPYSHAISFDNCNYISYYPSMIYNNFFQAAASNASYLSAAIMCKNSTYIKFYFNNCRVFGNSTNSSPIALQNTTSITNNNIQIFDNILANEAGGYVFYSNYNNTKFTKDYNFYYKQGSGNFSYYNSVIQSDYASFKNLSGGGVNSDTINPYFFNSSDLHVGNNMLSNRGTPMAGISTDIDGDTRNTTTPDPGADEFDPSPWDIAALEVLSPMGGCGLDSNEIIILRVKNVGSDTINGNLTLHYKWPNMTTPISESISTIINPGDTLDYTFTTLANLNVSPYGVDSVFEIRAWGNLTGDIVHFNDSSFLSVNSDYQPPAPITSNITINYGTSTTLTAISPDSLTWWQYDTSTVSLANTNSYTTPILSDTTTFYVSAGGGLGPAQPFNVGTQSSIYTASQTRGYHFQCPMDIVITELMVPTTVAGPQNIQVVKFTGPPAAFPGPGTPFTTLFYVSNVNTTTPIQVSIPILAGDYIGIVGARGASSLQNSYGSSLMSSIGGQNIQISRLVLQSSLASGQAASGLFMTDGTGSIGRVEMSYSVGSGGGGCVSQKTPLTVNVINFPALDGSLSSLVSPGGNIIASTPTDIKVALANYGTTTITTANIYYRINGQMQSTFAWSGSLQNGDIDTVTLAANHQFSPGLYNITAWTKLPNGSNDPNAFNDTVSRNFIACLSGTYTIGDTVNGAHDFPSFNSAVQTMQLAGLCGSVVFNVAPGVYNEQVVINNISTNPNATITFQSANGDSTSVVLQYNPTSSASNYIVRLDDMDYVNFNAITIKSLGVTYSTMVELLNASKYNSFTNNVVRGASITSSYSRGFSSGNTNENYNSIINNRIVNVYYGIYLRGVSSTAREVGNIFKDNQLDSMGTYSVYSYYQDSINIIGNTIQTDNNGYGVYAYYNSNYSISENTLIFEPTSYRHGIYVYYSSGTASGHSLVSNNMINVIGGTGSTYGIYSYYSYDVDYYHNTVRINSTSASSRSLYLYGSTSAIYNNTINLVNNIWADSNGYAAYINTPNLVNQSNYNNYYTQNTSRFVYWTGNSLNLSALQAASNKDANSISVAPIYFSNSDLHLFTTQFTGLATSLAAVPYDIDYEVRSMTGPTIGADEVPILPYDVGITSVLNFPSVANEFQIVPISLVVKNFGTDTVSNFTVQYTVNNGVPVSLTYSAQLIPGQIDTVVMTPMLTPAGNSNFCATTVYAPDINFFNDGLCLNFLGTPVWDAKVSRIFGLDEGCGLGLDTVNIWIHNLGVDTINGVSQTSTTYAKYTTGSTIISEIINAIINPGDSVVYTFTSFIQLGAGTINDTTYNVAAWIDQPNDNLPANDTAFVQIESLHTPAPPTIISPYSVPYASNVTLSASSTDTVLWYDNPSSQILIAQGPTYQIPGLVYVDDTFYVEARAGVPGTQVTIGTGTMSSYQTLANGWYNYSWSTNIYDANEIQGGGTIDTLYVQLAASVSSFTMNLQTIYLGHTTNSTHASNTYPGTGGKTLVFSGTITWSGTAGNWIAIPLQTSFSYNGFDNLLLHWENYDGTYTSGYPSFYCSSNTGKTIYAYSDSGFPTGTGSSNTYRPNIKLGKTSLACASSRIPYIVDVGNPPLNDVGVVSINSPNTGVNLGNSEAVNITVKNFGSNTQTLIPVAYRIGNGSIIHDTVYGTLAMGATASFTFLQSANLMQTGINYNFKCWTALSGDGSNLNDTASKSIQNNQPNYCPSNAIYSSYTELTNVTVGSLNNTSLANGSNYTDYSQSVAAANLAPGTNTSISVTSSFAPGYSSIYACYLKVFIDLNRDGDFTDPLETVYSGGTTTNNTVSASVFIPGNSSIGLTRMRVVLDRYGTSTVTTPCGTYSYGETEDYLVSLAPMIAQDAGIKLIMQPATIVNAPTLPLEVELSNYGTQIINSVQISYSINNSTPVPMNYSTPVAVGGSAIVNLGNINLQPGSNSVCVYTTLTGDNNTFNDMRCKNVYRQASVPLSYIDDFESNNLWLPDTIMNQWERGTPQMTNINSAHSGTQVWAIDLDDNYNNNSDDYLYSPTFITNNVDSAYMSFYQFMDVQSTSDFGVLQVSTGANIWSNLGYMGDPNATNWYNIQSGGSHFWSTTSSGWQQSTYFLDFTDPYAIYHNAPSVQFRFRFVSNASVNSYDGWAIDDFKIMLPSIQFDAGVVEISSPAASSQMGSTASVTIKVKNWGYDNLNNIPVSYTLGTNTVNDVIQLGSPLAPGATTVFTFPTTLTIPTVDFQICATTAYSGDTYTQNDQLCVSKTVSAANIDAGAIMVEINPNFNDTTYMTQLNTVSVQIKNFGLNTLTSIPIRYFLNTTLMATETWTGSLAPGATTNYTFTASHTSPLSFYNVIAETVVPNDANVTNDTAMHTYVGLPLGIELSKGGVFTLYQNQPNPANHITNIYYDVPREGDILFKLHNTLGQIVISKEISTAANKQSIELNTTNLESGIYYYSVVYEGVIQTRMMLIQH